jgi:hypothetical protein
MSIELRDTKLELQEAKEAMKALQDGSEEDSLDDWEEDVS